MPSEDRKIKVNGFHYQLIKEREYPGDYFVDIQFITYFFSSISNILSLLFFSISSNMLSPTFQLPSLTLFYCCASHPQLTCWASNSAASPLHSDWLQFLAFFLCFSLEHHPYINRYLLYTIPLQYGH